MWLYVLKKKSGTHFKRRGRLGEREWRGIRRDAFAE
jgi:hypothetical protein